MVAKDRMGSNPIGGIFFLAYWCKSSTPVPINRRSGGSTCMGFYPEQDVKRFARTVVERKHIGLIIQRTQDQNLAVRYFLAA